MVYRVQTVAPSVTVAAVLFHLFLLAILALSASSNADADADHRSTTAISPRTGSLFCRGAKRCRIFSVTMSTPASSGGTCKEYCVLFPLLKPKLTCGSCPTNKGVVPVAAPVTAPTVAAAPAAVSGPASTPQVAPAPTPTGTIPVAVPNSAPVAKGAVPVASTPTDAYPITAPLSRAPVPTGTVPVAATPTGTVPPISAPPNNVPNSAPVPTVAAPKSTPAATPSGGVPVAAPKAAPVPTPNVAAPVPKAAPVVAPNAAPVVPTPTDSSFTIQLEMVDVPTADTRFYTTAKASWEKVVVGDLPDVVTTTSSFPKYLTDEPFSRCAVPNTIDDTYICVAYQNLGDGEAYGIGGPLFARYGRVRGRYLAGTTIYGNITINSAYQDGKSDFTGLATHEMGHVLGIGTAWTFDLTNNIEEPTPGACFYNGTNAVREYKAVSGCNRVPIVTTGSGYCGGHWGSCLRSDVVSYNAATGRITPISVGSLQDQGYKVDYSKVQSFTAADLGTGCTCPSARRLRATLQEQPESLLDVPHGATAQLGMSNDDNNAPHRRLSDSGHQAAVGLGRSILAQRATTMSSHARRRLEDSGVVYVGDKVVSVLMMEDGQVFSVVVKP